MTDAFIFIGAILIASIAICVAIDLFAKWHDRHYLSDLRGTLAPAEGPDPIATKSSMETIPFREGVALRFTAHFSKVDFEKIKRGLLPHGMDDRWFMYFEDPHLFIHCYPTGEAAYRVSLKHSEDSAAVIEALWASEHATGNESQIPWQSAVLDWIIASVLLKQARLFPSPASFGLA
jgi:hypothetical protein